MNTIQNNKLIAEFMGIDFMNHNIFINRLPKDFINYSDSYKCFHNSWDWLMEVVEKIDNFQSYDVGCGVSIYQGFIRLGYNSKNKKI